MSARDELAKLLFITDNSNASDVEAEWRAAGGAQLSYIYAMADALIAAGYSKPRIIESVADLNELGRMATVIDAHGSAWVNDGDHAQPWASFAEDPQGGPIWADGGEIHLPVTVLHEP